MPVIKMAGQLVGHFAYNYISVFRGYHKSAIMLRYQIELNLGLLKLRKKGIIAPVSAFKKYLLDFFII